MKKNILTTFIALGLFLGSSRIIYAHVEPQMTPQAALEKLKAGNSRFAHGIAETRVKAVAHAMAAGLERLDEQGRAKDDGPRGVHH